jgi:peptide deformylase
MTLQEQYVKSHAKISRQVVEEDLERVQKDAEIMYELCFKKYGLHRRAHAIAHPQINSTDPLSFFVRVENEIIINPVIVGHDPEKWEKVEGCMSFPDKLNTPVLRWHRIEVKFQKIEDGKLVDHFRVLKNLNSQIWQHEIDHLNAKYIF